MNHFTLSNFSTPMDLDFDELEFLDEDSINQQAYLEELERDLGLGFPRALSSSEASLVD